MIEIFPCRSNKLADAKSTQSFYRSYIYRSQYLNISPFMSILVCNWKRWGLSLKGRDSGNNFCFRHCVAYWSFSFNFGSYLLRCIIYYWLLIIHSCTSHYTLHFTDTNKYIQSHSVSLLHFITKLFSSVSTIELVSTDWTLVIIILY